MKHPPTGPAGQEADSTYYAAACAQATRLAGSGAPQAAVDFCLQALGIFGDKPPFLKILGTLAFNQGDLRYARDFYLRLTRVDPDDAMGWAGLGMVYGAGEQTGEAICALQRAVSLKPNQPAPYLNLAIAFMKAQRESEALDLLRDSVVRFPDFAPFHIWLGHAYSALGDALCARRHYRLLLEKNPEDTSVRLPLALLERDQGNLPESNRCLEAILSRQPDHPVATFMKSQNLLMVGDYKTGFALYESRWRRPGMSLPACKTTLWSGENITNADILVHAEQGFGDMIQFSRLITPLSKMARRVGLLLHPRLRRLLSVVDGVDYIICEEAENRADFHIAMMGLPHRLDLAETDFASCSPYLRAEKDLRQSWQKKLADLAGGARFRVGMIWQGDPNSQSEKGRSVPFEKLRAFFDMPNIHYFLLQKQDGLAQLEGVRLPANVSNLGGMIDLGDDAFLDTAAIMTELDLVISSDTAPAHLAGALAVPVWVMLKYIPEWRWGLARRDSPWYPTMTLYRQKYPGDWEGVVAELSRDLENMVKEKESR